MQEHGTEWNKMRWYVAAANAAGQAVANSPFDFYLHYCADLVPRLFSAFRQRCCCYFCFSSCRSGQTSKERNPKGLF